MPVETMPSIATSSGHWDPIERALADIQSGALATFDRRGLAAHLGIAVRSLEETCLTHRHASARTLISDAQIARAQELLSNTPANWQNSAHDCGFQSVSDMDVAMVAQLGVTTAEWADASGTDSVIVRLPHNFRHAETLAYLARDSGSLTMQRAGQHTLNIAWRCRGRPLAMALHFGASAVTATIEARGKVPEEAGRAAILLLVRLLGRTTATLAFEQRARTDTAVKRLLADRLGLGISLTHTPFDAAVWSIIGQQISLPFAYQMLRSATQLAGAQAPGGLRTMPLPERLADMTTDALRACKFSASKARYLIDIAGLVCEGSLTLDDRSRTSAKRLFERLLAVRGLGPWSVNYIMMRGFGLTDCAPIGDAGLRRALNHFLGRTGPMDAQSMAKAMEPFAPHRSLATFHLWRSLDD